MNRAIFCTAILSAMALIATGRAGNDKEESQLRLELDLMDSSRVIGIPGIESVQVQTSYAKIDVALKHLRLAEVTAAES